MTLVIAAHLSDRVLLAADSRATIRSADGETYDDNQLKIARLNENILVACAGDAYLASFIVQRLKEYCGKIDINEAYLSFHKKIDEFAKAYWASVKELDYNKSFVILTFVGIVPTDEKPVDLMHLLNEKEAYANNTSKLMAETAPGKELSQLDEETLRKVATVGWNRRAELNPIVSATLLKNIQSRAAGESFTLKLPVPDSKVFQADVSCHQGPSVTFKLVTTVQLEPSGGRYKSSDIDPDIIREMEFGIQSGQLETDAAKMINLISGAFDQYINGCVVAFTLSKDGIQVATGKAERTDAGGKTVTLFETSFIDDAIHRWNGNSFVPLQSVESVYKMRAVDSSASYAMLY